MPKRERSRLGSKREVRPGVWEVRVSSGRRLDGAQRRVCRTVYGTERDADASLAELAVEVSRSPSIGEVATVAEFWPHFVRRCEAKGLARQTMKGYEKEWRLRVEPEFGSLRWRDVTFPRVQSWVYGMTRSSAQHAVRLLKRLINCAVDAELVDRNVLDHRRVDYPVERVDPFAEAPVMWGAREVAECMGRIRGEQIEALWLALVGGGLRVEEGLGMVWSDLTWAEVMRMDGTDGHIAHASVVRAWTEPDGYKAPKNRFSRRVVPIPDPFASRLLELRRDGDRAGLYPLYPGRSRKEWRGLFAEGHPLEGMPYARMTDMRSVHETILQGAGVLDTVNARMHGRTNVQTGYAHYLKPSAALDEASLAFTDALHAVNS